MTANDEVAPAQPEKWLQQWVYIGLEAHSDKKVGQLYTFLPIDEAGQLGAKRWYSVKNTKKSFGHLHVGAIYSVEANNDQVWSATKKYVGLWHDEGQRAAWQAREKAREARESAERREARETDENALDKLLLPLRREYQKTNWRGQLALELVVLNSLRKYVKDEED